MKSATTIVASRLATGAVALVALAALPLVAGHEHHDDELEEGQAISDDPIDSTLWAHIFVQMLAWGVIFPLGMVLGMGKSRWHVPVQVVGTVLAILGYTLGHSHGGRSFRNTNVHSKFVNPLSFLLALQVIFGIYLKLHIERGIWGKIRNVIRIAHGIIGKVMPILSWTQMLFGGITALGFCQDEYVGQCAAHFIMGSTFVAYGIILTLILLGGQLFVRRTGKSQEFFDSAVIAAWGCVNTFTEHRWGHAWGENDWQHTAMGIVWWCAGLAGIWLSKDRQGRPQRHFIPGFVLVLTGWAMSAHGQEMMVSAETHKVFGYTLMAAGISRIIEVSFIVKNQVESSDDESDPQVNSFQYIPAFLLFASGFLFMGATQEQMQLVEDSRIDHVAYILILFSLAFLVFLFVLMLVSVYERCIGESTPKKEAAIIGRRPNGAVPLRDAQEFELEGLMSDDDEEDVETRHKRNHQPPLVSPYADSHSQSGADSSRR